MKEIECTIYDCEFDLYHKGIMADNVVYVLDKEGNKVPANEHICEYVDYGMTQFYTGDYGERYGEPNKNNSKWGYFLFSTGEVVVSPVYDYAYPFYGDRAKVQKGSKYGFIDSEGREVVRTIWDDTANSLYQGLCWVRKGDKFGYIDKFGAEVLKPQFELARELKFIGEDYKDKKYAAIVKNNGKYGFIDEKGKYIFEPSFEEVKGFWSADYKLNKRYAPVKAVNKWSFINTKGEFAVAFQFDEVGEEGSFYITYKSAKDEAFREDERVSFYTVSKDGQWGLMKADFEIIMPEDGQAYVEYKDTKIYIKKGRITSIRKSKVKKK